jgi:trk system potassium uptake protein TrkH
MTLAVNFRLIFHFCGWGALMLAAAMLAPCGVGLYLGDGAWSSFLAAAALIALLGAGLVRQGRRAARDGEARNRDGLATVGLAWLMIGVLGAAPYWISGTLTGWDGLFESFSGFSATGATAAADVESLPPSINFWRALSHWLGGMGIIVLMLAVLPFFGLSGVQLLKNENSLAGDRPSRA